MKKAIKRFWGVGLIVMLLSSLFVAPVAPVSAGDYGFTARVDQPSALNRLLAPQGLTALGNPIANNGTFDITQTADGSTIYIVSQNNTIGNVISASYLYQSTNGGVTWTPAVASGFSVEAILDMVAVAPDDPNIVIVAANTTTGTPTIYLSTNGGARFSSLGATGNLTTINDISISPLSGPSRYIAAAGNSVAPGAGTGGGSVFIWDMGSVAPAWYDIVAGGGGPPWAALTTLATTPATIDDVEAAVFSSSFTSDQAILFVTETVGAGLTTGNITLHVGSFNTRQFDGGVDATFPRSLESSTAVLGSVLTCARAEIALDPAFYLGDAAQQIGFIAAQISSNITEIGGVYRTTITLAQIMDSGTAYGSVAWDGTNLVAAPYVAAQPAAGTAITIQRSSDALASSAAAVTFLPSSTAKTPGTGFEAKLIWNGGNVICVSRGTNAAVASSADLGKTFNGIALVNSNMALIRDIWVSPDTSVIYMVTDDGVDINVWRYMDSAWERVCILIATGGTSGQAWMVRAANSDPSAVLLGRMLLTNMFISTDAGETAWTARSSSAGIQDFIVQSADVVVVASSGVAGAGDTSIVMSTNGAFTWGPPTDTNINQFGGGNLYSITYLSDDNYIVGGSAGGVAYYTGGVWTAVPVPLGAGGSILANASGLETGNAIFAASSNGGAGSVGRWVIGTNTPALGWTTGAAANTTLGASGLAYFNGVLYVLDDLGSWLQRYLDPLGPAFGFDEARQELGTYGNVIQGTGTAINSLQSSDLSGTLLSAVNAGATDSLDGYSSFVDTAADALPLSYPADGQLIQVNSLTGAANTIVFQWSSPPPTATTILYNYELQIYLDEAGTVPVAGSAGPPAGFLILAAGTPAPTVSVAMTAIGAAPGFVPVPGTTYYWRVRVGAASPARSHWSEMRSFTIQPLAAAVPVIASPENGATIDSSSRGFSWTPISLATMYKFELSTTPDFTTTLYSTTTGSTGVQLPADIELEEGAQYFWRVKAIEPVEGDWSTVGNFIVAVPAPPPTSAPPPVTVTNAPDVIVTVPPATVTSVIVPPPEPAEEIAPAYIWVIIIIGAILVIAVIVLIVRTRRSV